jgi:hypothetical protein
MCCAYWGFPQFEGEYFFAMAQQPVVGQGLHWTSDQPDAQTCYRTTHNTHKGQTSMPPLGFEPTVPASERLQTHALDPAATGIGLKANSKVLLKDESWLLPLPPGIITLTSAEPSSFPLLNLLT